MFPILGYSLTDDCDGTASGINPSDDELCTDTIDEDYDGHMTHGAVDFTT